MTNTHVSKTHLNRRLNSGRTAPRVHDALQESELAEAYVENTWSKLTRDLTSLFLPGGIADPKMPAPPDNRYFLYISLKEDKATVECELGKARELAKQKTPEEQMPVIEVVRLKPGTKLKPEEQGLLYVPHPYVVPGVRYNEMYNWDSIFIGRGLLGGEHFDEAKHLLDNLLYEVKHYGTILNGNRTYYLDDQKSRSQPPLITDYILTIFNNWDQLKHVEPGETKTDWLKNSAERIEEYYQHWITAPHGKEDELSRYDSFRTTPSEEVINGEKGHYEGALQKLHEMAERQRGKQAPLTEEDREERYFVDQFLTSSGALSEQFYRGDTAMRESGFDPSGRFGFYNADVPNYLPVCLNSLRLKMESEMLPICEKLKEYDAPNADHWETTRLKWETRRNKTQQLINAQLWDEGTSGEEHPRKPCYRDRNTNKELCTKHGIPEFRDYNFATALFPLWAGAASPEQAEQVVKYILPVLMTPSGLNTSDRETGCQWDKPLLWAPLQVIAVEALERYHYYEEALDVAIGYLSAISKDFKETGKLYEKYESNQGSSKIREHIDKGYFVNDEGFGWTNAAVIDLRHAIKRLNKKISLEQREDHTDSTLPISTKPAGNKTTGMPRL